VPAVPPPRTNRARNGRSGPNGKVATPSSADLTAEIRRLASESAQKVSQASRVVLVTDDDDDDVTDAMPLLPVETPAGQTTVGPVPRVDHPVHGSRSVENSQQAGRRRTDGMADGPSRSIASSAYGSGLPHRNRVGTPSAANRNVRNSNVAACPG